MQLLPEDTARPHPDRMVTGWKREGVYEASRPSRRKPCIPIADDDPDIRESMCGAIASWHCVALGASSGSEALDILGHRRVDVVLCDVVKPAMDGAETLREIRQRVLALPVIMMSAMTTPHLR